ncbi:chloramphenicol phosphotransferase [Streptomyces benahoarensis]|uniref:Chloramphenicol phosphotransferase n=2 Tax=Streptomyces benahoarensis TaxID=2595054 RepID=A0A553Y1V1_9ACTN|nr:chloramphenicol phosphotransferase [Streptomyces benahoarensis]TSB23210.1 chloramphenicol phosphotransferase [Streptomyces benahoarensis]
MIILNGGSSSGTSSLARALQDVLPRPWLTFGVDSLIEALPPGLMDDPDGLVLGPDGSVTPGAAFHALQDSWRHGVAAVARAGAPVILDEVFLGGGEGRRAWERALGDLPVLWVGVRCDAAVATARERARPDRVPGMAAAQASLVHRGMTYDIEVDTGRRTAQECAREVAERAG